VPDEELCFLMFEATCEQDVRVAAHRGNASVTTFG